MRKISLGLSRVAIIVLITIVLTAGIVVATSPTQPFTINRGVYPGAASFTLWVEDGTYFAKNQYGVIAYSGADATVILDTIASIGNVDVYINPGNYSITHCSISADNVHLIGSGANTIFSTTGDDYLLRISVSHNFVIEGITFEGDGDTLNTLQTLVTVSNDVSGLQILNCRFLNSGYDGINLLFDVTNSVISNNYFENIGDDAINPGGGGGAGSTINTIIYGNIINGTTLGDGIHLSTQSVNSIVDSNIIYDAAKAGIGIYNSQNHTISNNIIRNCVNGIKCLNGDTSNLLITNNQIFGAIGSGSDGCGITLAYASTNTKVIGNTVKDAATYGIWVLNSYNTSIIGNSIYDTPQGIRVQTSSGTFITNNNFIGIFEYGIVQSNAGYLYDVVINNYFYGTITYDAIRVNHEYGTYSGNVFKGSIASWCTGEYGSADYNMILNSDGSTQTNGFHTIGANSVGHTSFNGTSGWVA